MKKISRLFLWSALLAFASGCRSGAETRAKKQEMGVGQGNGLVQYSNSAMALSFSYPSGWNLSQSVDAREVTLDNSPLAQPGTPVSLIRFMLTTGIFGQTVETPEELLALLVKRWPTRKWAPVPFGTGQVGYYWSDKGPEGSSLGEYYLLDANRNILQFTYRSFAALDGARVITGIVASMTGCSLPKDQGTGSLHGSWQHLPITLVFDHEFYEMDGGKTAAALKRAAQTWNGWAKLKGLVAFVIKDEGTGMFIPPVSDCSATSYTSELTSAVGVWKIDGTKFHENQRTSCGMDQHGNVGKLLSSSVPGETNWTIEGGRITGASILLNFDDYNAPGKPSLDVESAFLHELGHVLGLLHSCNGSNAPGRDGVDSTTAPLCYTNGSLTAPPAYTSAVMFPFLLPDEQRRSLGQNDYDRVNCLY